MKEKKKIPKKDMKKSFDLFIRHLKERIEKVNQASAKIHNTVMSDGNKEWKAYKDALAHLQSLLKDGLKGKPKEHIYRVQSCIAEFMYARNDHGETIEPLKISGFVLRGWVQSTCLADNDNSSVSSSSSSSSSGG